MTTSDAAVGQQVRESREASLLSQQDVAAIMRTRGYKWSQATVWSVESGERPLRYTESLELAEICGFGATSTDRYEEGLKRGLELSREALERIARG